MEIDWYRDKVMHCPRYNNATWHEKVLRMSDVQVYALYYKFKSEGLFDEKIAKKKDEQYHQMTLFEWQKELGLDDDE